MKKIIIALSCATALFYEGCSGCKEVGPNVNLVPSASDSYDTTYSLSSSETAALTSDPHNVLIEEFTGQNCNNCPSAHETLHTLSNANPGRLNIIGLYVFGIPQGIPPTGSVNDFRDSTATRVGNDIYGGVPGLPSGGIDRLPNSTGIETNRAFWGSNVASQLSIPDSMNLSLTSSWDATNNIATIISKVTFTQDISTKQHLNVVITEDSMMDLQEFPDSVHTGYVFTNVFRDMVSSPVLGDPILDTVATKLKGRVFKRTYYYKLKTKTPAIIPANCHVVAFISNSGGAEKRIIQSTQTKLVP